MTIKINYHNMKPYILILTFILGTSLTMSAQYKYYDASALPLLGKISPKTETLYERLPVAIREQTRKPVWELGQNSTGLAVRFSSDSPLISAKWEVSINYSMVHMTPTGIKGLDLYCWEDSKWVFVNSARPYSNEKIKEAVIIDNMEVKEREYMLYLPLYDGISSLEIGVDSAYTVSQPKVSVPQTGKPIICYGTSILQGGCASRPGMAHTSILSRWLNREFINLGFSGNGQLDYEIAEIIAEREASVIILDFMPNVNVEQIREKMIPFYEIIRKKQPDVPIIFIENPIFPHGRFDKYMQTVVEEKNKELHIFYNILKSRGEKNISLVSSEDMIGHDGEATVDGIHFTDLGFMRYAEYLYPYIKEVLYE